MLSTHVLDTSRGMPAAGVHVILERVSGSATHEIVREVTDADGRVRELLGPSGKLEAGDYRLTFGTGAWFAGTGIEAFYPSISVTFTVRDSAEHHHVPLLLSPYGYSTYRGS